MIVFVPIGNRPVDTGTHGPRSSPQESAAWSEAVAVLHSILDAMPDGRREIFVLSELEQMTCPEIARELGCTPRTAKFHLENVLKKMGTPDRLKLAVTYWRSMAKQKRPKGSARPKRPSARA